MQRVLRREGVPDINNILFSRKHYNAIAVVFKHNRKKYYYAHDDDDEESSAYANGLDDGHSYGVTEMIEKLADMFAADNPSFNRDKFIAACEEDDEIKQRHFERDLKTTENNS